MLALVGATGLVACAPSALSAASPIASSAAATAAAPSCIVRPAVTEGPYFVDEKLNRSDIRSDPSNGAVKPGAAFALTFNVAKVSAANCVSLANAQVDIWHCDAAGVYSDATDPSFNTKGQRFLRGYQVTDANGEAAFTTIYPGWYQGRAVHIHFKIRTAAANGSGWMKNAQDGIYTGGGDKLLLKPTQSGSSFAATFDIGLA